MNVPRDFVPVATASVALPAPAIEAGLTLDEIKSETREGLRIIVDEKRILIAGQSTTATMRGVCRFLEQLGCRYFMDGPLGEVYPRSASLSIAPVL